jgi:hypothetical protein
MSETVERCPYCTANLKMFWHTLNSGLVTILIEAIQFVHNNNKNVFHLQKDLHLTVNQFSDFTKLRFHVLVAKVDGKPGFWLITARGGAFLRGEIAVPLRVKTFRNKVLEHSHELIHINELKGKLPAFEQQYAYETMRPAVEPAPGKQEKLYA